MAEGNGSGGHMSRWTLKGMTALVTGGTKGIGYAIVEELAELGATVHTCARNKSEVDESVLQWQKKGFKVTGSVNNIGKYESKPTVEYTVEDFSFLIATNFESAYHLSQLAHPLMKASGQGSIIFVSSVCGVFSVHGPGSIYGVTKGAMNQLGKNLACEWAKDNIRANSVAPWYIKTPLTKKILDDETYFKGIISRTPMGRTGEPKEVSSLVALQAKLFVLMVDLM